jgi:RimJ/RimL family protein N-acetyltransferase
MKAPLIDLVSMTEKECLAFLENNIVRYAEENVRAGYWNAAEAQEKSRRDHHKLLPQGIATKNHFLFNIVRREARKTIGTIWMALKPEDSTTLSGFIYDLYIDEPSRRKGYAMQAMHAVEHKARELGAHTLYLHVFGHNEAAQALYSKLGYATTSLNMGKKL